MNRDEGTQSAGAGDPSGAPAEMRHRRNRLAGLWAAELLGLIGHAASDYAKSVMHVGHAPDREHPDDAEEVAEKLAHDLGGRSSKAEILEKLGHFLHEAKRQLHGDNSHGDNSGH